MIIAKLLPPTGGTINTFDWNLGELMKTQKRDSLFEKLQVLAKSMIFHGFSRNDHFLQLSAEKLMETTKIDSLSRLLIPPTLLRIVIMAAFYLTPARDLSIRVNAN